jgi:2-polyprenyl-6-methoxyphenol hydroxylase-like FAD-dependent oxidoreductase
MFGREHDRATAKRHGYLLRERISLLRTTIATKDRHAEASARAVEETDCCIVGGGPAGLMLAFLLARQGVRVTLLEAHRDFDREFRGNTINPSAMEVLARLGLEKGLLSLRHAKARHFTIQDGERRETFADFSRLKTRYPYVLMLPQARFLELVAAEAERYRNFRLVMGARVRQLVIEGGVVRGVRWRGSGEEGAREVRAGLTVGTDGRFSRCEGSRGSKQPRLAARRRWTCSGSTCRARKETQRARAPFFGVDRGACWSSWTISSTGRSVT